MSIDERVRDLRCQLSKGDGISQHALDGVVSELIPFKPDLRPKDKSESLPLFSPGGVPLGTTAPRWICHILGLRHRCTHILLVWKSPSLGDVLVVQVRDWEKDDSPGYLDISVGGHMVADEAASAEDTAFTEMLQETGLSCADLIEPLEHVGGYETDDNRPDEGFYNSEWRDVYVGRITHQGFSRIRFADGEVAGVLLVPAENAPRILEQSVFPVASGLTGSLPMCLEYMNRTGSRPVVTGHRTDE